MPSNIEPQKFAEVRLSIGNALKPLLKGIAAKIDYPESKSDTKASARRDLAINLHDKLKKRLSKYKSARAGLSATNYELVENAAWQHQHKFQKGAFPYKPNDKKSVENRHHPYSLNGRFPTRAKFLRYLRRSKIITPYNPIADFGELGEAKCIKYAIEYCDAKNSRSRRIAKKHLDDIIRADSTNARHATKYLAMIESQGAL